jgi:hypothetical protein
LLALVASSDLESFTDWIKIPQVRLRSRKQTLPINTCKPNLKPKLPDGTTSASSTVLHQPKAAQLTNPLGVIPQSAKKWLLYLWKKEDDLL